MHKSVTFNPSVEVRTMDAPTTSQATTTTSTPLTTVNTTGLHGIATSTSTPKLIPLTPTPGQTAGSESQSQQGTQDVQSTNASTNSASGFNFGFPPATTTSTACTSQPASVLLMNQTTLPSVGNVPVPASTFSAVATTSGNFSQGQINQGQVSSTTANLRQPTTAQGTTMTFQQLQVVVDTCMTELLAQEERFEAKVKEVNDLDQVLVSNGEKITQLQFATDTVKKDHVRIESGLGYLKAQQLELENALGYLEQSLSCITPQDDPNRFILYDMGSRVDRQLLQIGVNLKDVIDQINERNSREQTMRFKDPVVDILKILNKHTDALLWIEESCNKLKTSLTDVCEKHLNLKKDHVASMRRSMQ